LIEFEKNKKINTFATLNLKVKNMKAVLDIKESKAPFVMELLGNFSFVKVQPITNEKALLLNEIREAVNTINLIKKGKIQARPAKELLNEI
jgi:hypothetical protein